MIEDKENTINLKEELFKYLAHWRWFVLSVFIALICAFLYLKFTPKSYSVSTKILIKDEKSNDLANQLSAFSEMSLLGNSKNNIENEVEILKSRTLIYNTLDSLNLNIQYLDKTNVITKDLYKKNPIQIVWTNNDISKTVSIDLTDIKNNSFHVSVNDENIGESSFGKQIKSQFGAFTINKIGALDKLTELKINVFPKMQQAESYQKVVSVAPSSKTSSIIDVSIIDKTPEKAADFLNTLVYNYNLGGIKDKRFISENTANFISDRLSLIATELGDVESQVEGYKNNNNLSDIQTEVKLYLDNLSSFEKSVLENETKINVVTSLISHVSKAKQDDLVPGGLLSEDAGSESIIQEINQLILEKQKLSFSATTENDNYIKLESQIRSLKSNLLASLRRNLSSLQIVKNDYKRQEGEMQTKLAQVPRQEREFRVIDRQQKVKEALYLFLLQKREETNITLAATDMNAKVIDKAIATDKPVSPKTMIVLLAALVLGTLIPFIYIYIKNLLDTKIKTRFDITDNTDIPFLGDVPTSETSNELMEISSRSSAAEAIRIVRTNLDFILSDKQEEECKTIFLTSTISGEGKTFVSANLAATFALSGKKVLLIGFDLRNPKLYEYLKVNPLGVTNYITSNNKSIEEFIIPVEGYTNFDVLSSGSIPPNPTEILMNKKVKELFETLKSKYDYIIVDTAPVSLVTDTLLIGKYADATIYVVRANKIDKEMLRIPNELYKDHKLNKLTMVLNDSDVTKGYGYGYGYGYGAKAEKTPFWKKLLGTK
ncbi:polysaccharide biosynthesis tyrosine autokinase [Flavobacterium sp. xlx-214]|uniref:GumC family protein n=1 Tax=unclassified Flavobacterium TaxID=196869 RepID=UPI0013D35E85|nr:MULTISPECIES: tyrosine-protein kinase [unclassified Flavobacterium]MBA5791232.1 polysaccharide biosynthesis tyrosine autokinase [Flavobacterium sp. xlx-221]QMI83601.1 polysaccharide biosynthesis tyrosine autokinase [Flavobacterium sp. xlx-214]